MVLLLDAQVGQTQSLKLTEQPQRALSARDALKALVHEVDDSSLQGERAKVKTIKLNCICSCEKTTTATTNVAHFPKTLAVK